MFFWEAVMIKAQARSYMLCSLRSISQASCISYFHSWSMRTWGHVWNCPYPMPQAVCLSFTSAGPQLTVQEDWYWKSWWTESQIAETKSYHFNWKIYSAGARLQERMAIPFCIRQQQVIWWFSVTNTIGHIRMVDEEMKAFIFCYQIPKPSGS